MRIRRIRNFSLSTGSPRRAVDVGIDDEGKVTIDISEFVDQEDALGMMCCCNCYACEQTVQVEDWRLRE